MAEQGTVQCKPFLYLLDPLQSPISAEILGFAWLKAHVPPYALLVAMPTLGRRSQQVGTLESTSGFTRLICQKFKLLAWLIHPPFLLATLQLEQVKAIFTQHCCLLSEWQPKH